MIRTTCVVAFALFVLLAVAGCGNDRLGSNVPTAPGTPKEQPKLPSNAKDGSGTATLTK